MMLGFMRKPYEKTRGKRDIMDVHGEIALV
jgi:hypothetical protein